MNAGSSSAPQHEPIIGLIRALPGFNGLRFSPLPLIKAVNAVQALGAASALSLLETYLRQSQQHPEQLAENVLLVARVLFVRGPDDAALPSLMLGQPDLGPPQDLARLPLFPLYLCGDLPLLLVSGYLVGGQPAPPSEYLIWCRQQGRLRPDPLVPADDPLAAVDQFLASDAWHMLRPQPRHRAMLRWQALRAVSEVYPLSGIDEENVVSMNDDLIWSTQRQAVAGLQIAWNPAANAYQKTGH